MDHPQNNPHDNKSLNEHDEHDGIQELNNPAPFWWQFLFYATIAFSLLYIGYYWIGDGPSHQDELARDLARIDAMKTAAAKANQAPDSTKLLSLAKNPEALAKGKQVFVSKCASCHAADGGGLIGPNLTDNAWINGDGTVTAIYSIIEEGVTARGMPAWKSLMSADELASVAAYVYSLKGTRPAAPKAPQGKIIN